MGKEQTIFHVLQQAYHAFKDKEAVYDGYRRLTYRDLMNEVDSLAAAMIELGIGKEDKVIVCLPNWSEFVVIYFALAKIGAVLIPGNPAEQNKGWERIVTIPSVRALFCSPIEEKTERFLQQKLLDRKGVIVTVRFCKDGVLSYEKLVDRGKTLCCSPKKKNVVKCDDLFAVLYTSGSTGKPKGVMLTHGNFIYSAENVVRRLRTSAKDVFFVPVPFSHIFGLVPGLLTVIMSGGKMVLMEKYHIREALQLITQEKVSVHYGVPTMFILELNAAAKEHVEFYFLRTGIIAGAPCPENIVTRIMKEMRCNVVVSYGATEACGGITYTSLTDTCRMRALSIGKPLPGTEIKIVGSEGEVLPTGAVGELACRGKGISKGYYKTEMALQSPDGWYYTGDLARMDNAGNIFFSGRKKDIIIRGGMNIYPAEIEAVFYKHQHVAEAAVIGVPDPILGEAVCAVIRLAEGTNETEESLKVFMKENVAKYKVADHILFKNRFALTQTGKIDKKSLSESVKNIFHDGKINRNEIGSGGNKMADFTLSTERQEVQKRARDFTAENIIPVAREWDEKGGFHEFILEKAKAAGLNCIAVPKEYGGAGYDAVTQSLVAEEWGYGCVAFSTTLGGNGLSTYPLAIAGTDEQKKLYYGRIVAGGMGGFALTEPGAGSDAGSCTTTAKLDGDEWVINGTKCFATTCGYAEIMVVFASTDLSKGVKGLSAFIVEKEREGVIVGAEEHKMGIRSSNTVELLLKNVRVPKDHLLGKEGEGMKIAMKTLDMARPIVASAAVGLSRRALDEALNFAKTYIDVNGKPIGKQQDVGFKLADMAVQVEAARQLIHHALRLKDAGQPYTKEAAMAKTFATDTAMKVTTAASEIMGVYGYAKDCIIEKLMRDAKVTQIYEGTNQVQRIVISGILMNS